MPMKSDVLYNFFLHYFLILFSEAQDTAALLCLPSQLSESSLVITQEAFDALPEETKVNPIIVSSGEVLTDNEFYQVYMDSVQIVATNDLSTAFKVLMGGVYIFNLAFPKSHKSTMTFLQKVVINLQDRQARDNKVVKLAGKLSCKLK